MTTLATGSGVAVSGVLREETAERFLDWLERPANIRQRIRAIHRKRSSCLKCGTSRIGVSIRNL